MHRFLNIFLILYVLVTQSAWAIQSSELDVDDNNDKSGHAHSMPADQDNDSSHNCNHFCHASGHFVGLFTLNSIDILVTPDKHEITFNNLAISLSHQPPIPPPIS